MTSYINLVIEGGGIKAYSSIGVLKFFHEKGLDKNIKNIIGVSAGSIMAALFSVGCEYDDIEKIYTLVDFSEYKFQSKNILTYYKILFKNGIYDTEKFKETIIHKILELGCCNGNITFLEVYENYGKKLVIPGTCLNKRETHYYHYISNPFMKVKDAIAISCCVPFLFRPIIWKNDTLVDGGVIENYPLYFFNEKLETRNSRECVIKDNVAPMNLQTIGIKYINSNTSQDNELYKGNDKILSIYDYIQSFINTLMTSNERRIIKDDYWKQTIAIDVGFISSVDDLNIPENLKSNLINAGYDAAKKYHNAF
jgi:NTE family protein